MRQNRDPARHGLRRGAAHRARRRRRTAAVRRGQVDDYDAQHGQSGRWKVTRALLIVGTLALCVALAWLMIACGGIGGQ